jgi:hypothetical protein
MPPTAVPMAVPLPNHRSHRSTGVSHLHAPDQCAHGEATHGTTIPSTPPAIPAGTVAGLLHEFARCAVLDWESVIVTKLKHNSEESQDSKNVQPLIIILLLVVGLVSHHSPSANIATILILK